MVKRKQYRVTLDGQYLVGALTKELKCWGVKSTAYTFDGAVMTTGDTNAVDVVTETLMRYPNLYSIEVVNENAPST